jgi:hypothetical protein
MTSLSDTTQVSDVENGFCYEHDPRGFRKTNRLLEVQRLRQVYVKVPSDRGLVIHRDYTYHYRRTENEIRAPEGLERSEMLDRALLEYPEYCNAIDNIAHWSPSTGAVVGRINLHCLLLLKINYKRLRSYDSIHVPEARFVFLQHVSFARKWWIAGPMSKRVIGFGPAVIQESIDGILLLDMFESTGVIKQKWRPHMRGVASQLARILQPDVVNYFDWNLRNFVYAPATEVLWYIDPKPTVFIGQHANQNNLATIRRFVMPML